VINVATKSLIQSTLPISLLIYTVITAKVPSSSFETFIERSKIGVRVISENIQGKDVTDEYVDTAARLQTLNVTRVQLERLMAAGKTVTEILEVQRELSRVTANMEAMTARLNSMIKRSAMSSVTITLTPQVFGSIYNL
jgi:hypothetical protein